jgi:glycosyltransferase involved in cell wall biosynthesis
MTTPHELPPDAQDVAVIIPAFNAAAHIDQALASVAAQTLRPGAVVVVDDCSADDTADRASRWQDRLPVQLVRLNANRGPGLARDAGIAATGAGLLALLDADDVFLPDHLETMLITHARAPGLISAQELSWTPGAGLTFPDRRGKGRARRSDLHSLLHQNFVNFGFFSRALYEKAGGFADKRYCEDWDLWVRMARAGATIASASHPTAIHRVHPLSLSYDAVTIARHGIAFLTAELRAARSPEEAAAARAGLSALRGKLSFYRASELIAAGDVQEARRTAIGGLPGGGLKACAGLAALVLAPTTAARVERLTRRYRLQAGAYAAAGGSDRRPGLA